MVRWCGRRRDFLEIISSTPSFTWIGALQVLIELSKTGLSEKRKQVEGTEEEGTDEAKDPYLVVHPNYYVE